MWANWLSTVYNNFVLIFGGNEMYETEEEIFCNLLSGFFLAGLFWVGVLAVLVIVFSLGDFFLLRKTWGIIPKRVVHTIEKLFKLFVKAYRFYNS